MSAEIIRLMIFLGLLLFVFSVAFLVYKAVLRSAQKEKRIAEILMTTKEGKQFLAEQESKHKEFAKKMLPILIILFLVVFLFNIAGKVVIIKYIYEKGIGDIVLEDLKLLLYPVIATYLTILSYRFIKNHKTKAGE